MAIIGTDVRQAAELLRSGQVVGIPTETVYGLAANALDEQAVTKIFAVKNRPAFDPLICHVDSIGKVKTFVLDFPEEAEILARNFWPGPLTMLFPKKAIIPDITTSGLATVAFRIPRHPLTLSLLSQLSFPLAAPSANPFGYVSPTSAAHVAAQLGEKIDYILDGGDCQVGIESTIIGFENSRPVVYRLGGMPLELLQELFGTIDLSLNKSSNPLAPGQLKSHYAPSKKVIVGDIAAILAENPYKKAGIISFKENYQPGNDSSIVLSSAGDLQEAAKNLFKALRTLDSHAIEVIYTEKFPEIGLGKAINDRLQRSSTHHE